MKLDIAEEGYRKSLVNIYKISIISKNTML